MNFNQNASYAGGRLDPEVVATRIGQLWSSRVLNGTSYAPPTHGSNYSAQSTGSNRPALTQNENRVMLTQTARGSGWLNNEITSSDWFTTFNNQNNMNSTSSLSEKSMLVSPRMNMSLPMSFSSDVGGHNEIGLAMKRRNARVFLDKQRREWKVEWIEDQAKKMKRFSCKRWGKAKAQASALEYYYMVIKGLPVDPARPFFSQVRKFMEKCDQNRKADYEKQASKTLGEDLSDLFVRRPHDAPALDKIGKPGYESMWYDKASSARENDTNVQQEALQLAKTCGNLTVDVMCNAMTQISSLTNNKGSDPRLLSFGNRGEDPMIVSQNPLYRKFGD